MATGKTNSRFFRMVYGGYDLSGDARALGSMGSTYAETDVTGWNEGVVNFTLGTPAINLEGFQAVFNNTASTGIHSALAGFVNSYSTVFIGIRAAPAVGDPTFSIPNQQASYTVAGDGPCTVSVNMNPGQTGSLSVSGKMSPWGNALAVGASLSGSTNGTGVDNGASSSNGGIGYLHLTASSGGTWAFYIQHSTDNSTYTDLITFTSNGSAVTAEQGTVTGSVNRYVRFRAVRTSGTVSAWCSFVRL